MRCSRGRGEGFSGGFSACFRWACLKYVEALKRERVKNLSMHVYDEVYGAAWHVSLYNYGPGYLPVCCPIML